METTYEDLINHNSNIASILDRKVYKYVKATNERTINSFDETWLAQSKSNLKLLKKYGLLADHCKGMGLNKAAVMIGAGPSLKKNKAMLRELCLYNSRFPFDKQPFVFITCNHQYKPCLEYGIIPHFVVVVDASDNLYDQLCKGIPKRGQNTILISALHVHPKILNGWDRQGRTIQFYVSKGDANYDLAKEILGEDLDKKQMLQGGNVMNVAWMSSLTALWSKIFIATGYDISYEIVDSVEERRKSYYEDGDYSTNTASKRDEASGIKKWVGFEMYRCPFTGKASVRFKPMGTVGTLFNYKTWIEVNVAIQDVEGTSFHYYNCTEGGILGVVPKSYDSIDLENHNNWQLMDEVLPNKWHTRLLEDAAMDVLAARDLWLRSKGAIKTDVDAKIWLPKTGIVQDADLRPGCLTI